MEKILSGHYQINCKSEMSKVVGFTKKTHHAGRHICEEFTNKTNTEKVLLKCNYIGGSIVNGRREYIQDYFSLSGPTGSRFHSEPTLI